MELAHRDRTPRRAAAAAVLSRRYVRYLIAAGVYVAVGCLFFAGIVAHPGSRLLGGYGLSDAAGTTRDYDVTAAAGKNPFTFRHDMLNGAPEGRVLLPQTQVAQPVQPIVMWALRDVIGTVAAMNVFILSGILLTALAGFALLEWAGLGLLPSLFGGFAMAFNPYMVERAMLGHVGYAHGWALIALLAALTRLRLDRTIRWSLVAGAAYAVCFLLSAYMGLLATALVLAFGIVEVISRRSEWVRTLVLLSVVFGVTFVALLPGAVAYALDSSTISAGLSHDTGVLGDYAAQPVDYIAPVPRSLVFGWAGHLGGANANQERRVFVGWVMLGLAIFVGIELVRRRAVLPGPIARLLVPFAGVAALVALALSFGRALPVLGLRVPMPALPLTDLTTFYRVYARLGYVVAVCVAVLAAAALWQLLARGRRSAGLAVVLTALAVVEFLPGSLSTAEVGRPPAYDLWLARQPPGIAAHYPLKVASRPAELMGFRELYWQRFTMQPLFEIYSSSLVPMRDEAIRMQAARPNDPDTLGLLAAEGVRYLVVHDDVYKAQGDAPPVLGAGLQPLRRFGPVRVYRITAPPIDLQRYLEEHASEIADQFGLPRPAVTFGDGFYPPESYPGYSTKFHWMSGTGELAIDNTENAPVTIWLDGFGFSNAVERRVDVVDASGSAVAGVDVAPSLQPLRFGPFEVPPGTSTWTLRSSPGPAPLGGTDPRRASVYLSDLRSARKPDLSETLKKSG